MYTIQYTDNPYKIMYATKPTNRPRFIRNIFIKRCVPQGGGAAHYAVTWCL